MVSARSGESHLHEEILSRTFDGEVSPAEFVDILRHLGRCESCRQHARELWHVISILSGVSPNLSEEAGDLSDNLATLEEVVLSKLSDLISIHWTSCIPGVRLSKVQASRLKANIELQTRRAVRAKLGQLKRGILNCIAQGSPSDFEMRPYRRRSFFQVSLRARRFPRLLYVLRNLIRTLRPLGKVALIAWSSGQLFARAFRKLCVGTPEVS